jgi:hypothetical protein
MGETYLGPTPLSDFVTSEADVIGNAFNDMLGDDALEDPKVWGKGCRLIGQDRSTCPRNDQWNGPNDVVPIM